MALHDVNAVVTITTNAVKAIDDGKKLKQVYADINEQLNKMRAEGKTDTSEFKQMQKLAEDTKAKINEMLRGMELIDKVMGDISGHIGKDLNRALRETAKEFNKTSSSTDEGKAKLEKLRGVVSDLKRELSDRKGLTMSLKDAEAQLRNLNNASLDKLKQGLQAVQEEAAKTTSATTRERYQDYAKQYRAQIAVDELGRAGGAPIGGMNNEQLRAEQQRLRQGYMATEGVKGYEAISQEYLTRLQKVNQEIKNMTEAERKQAQAAKELEQAEQRRVEFARQGQQTHKTLANLEKASYEDMEVALKHLQEQYASYASGDTKHIQRNLQAQDKLKRKMKEMQSMMLSDEEISKRVNNTKKYNVIELQQAYDQLQQKLMSLASGEKTAALEIRRQMKSLKKDIEEVKGESSGLMKIWKTAVRNIATYIGVFAGFNMVKSKIMEVMKSNLQLSDSIAQVQKVTGLTRKEVDQLNRSFTKLDTRTALTQLNELAYSAGKMGLGKYGLEQVEGFVRATNQLQVALGDDLGNSVDEAITPLAKLAENLGLIQKMGVEKSMMAIGSSINELSQTTTAVGANIVDFARRVQPAAQMIGLTADQILALGSASDAFGVSSEISATAFTKFLAAYRTNTAEIEKILNMVPGTLDKFFDEGRTMDGLLAIFQRMHDIGDLRYLQEAFKALGSEGSRMFTTFGAFSKNIDMFREHLATSTQAFAEATSVTREYELVQNTAAGIMERANNIWEKAFVNPEGVDMVKEMAVQWYNLSQQLTQSESFMWGAKQALESIATIAGILIRLLPILVRAMFFYGAAAAIKKLAVEYKLLDLSMKACGTTAGKLGAFFRSNIWVLAATAIGFAVTALIDMAAASDKASKNVKKLSQEEQDLADAQKMVTDYTKKEVGHMEALYKAATDTLQPMEKRVQWVKQLKQEFPDYFKDLSDEAILTGKAANQYEALAQSLIKAAKARAYKDKMEKISEESVQLQEEIDNDLDYLTHNENRYKDEKKRQKEREDITSYGGAVFAGEAAKQGLNKKLDAFIDQYEQTENRVLQKQAQIGQNDERIKKLAAAAMENTPIPKATEFKPSGGGGEGGGGGTSKAPEWMVEEKKNAEKAAKAVIGSIEEFYRLQEAAANELAANGSLKGADFEMLISHIQDRKDKMLLEARRAIVGDPNEFENIRKSLETDIVKRDDAVSQAAMKRIQEAEPAKQGAVLRKYNGSDAVFGLDSNAWLNDVRKNAAQNELNIQRREAKLVQEIDKFLMQYQFIEQAQQDFGDRLVKMGLVTDGYAKVVKQLADGTQITANTKEVQQFANKVSGMGGKLYGVDTDNAQELVRMTRYMMTDAEGNEEGFASIFPDYKEWLKQPELYKDKMVALYELMIQYEGIYYDQIKKRDDLQSKRLDSWWEHSDEKKQNDKAMRSISQYEYQYSTMNEGQTMGFMMGLTNDLNQDPEVLREKAILEAKIAIWQKAKEEREANLISEEVYQQRLQDMQDQTMAYSQKVMENINKRISRIQAFVKPVENAAKTIGKKLGDMILNMESEEATWEKIWKDMALAVAESLLTMIGQYAQYQIQKAAINKSEVLDEAAKAQAITMLGISSGAAKTIGTLGWWGIALIPVITALLMGLLTSALSTAGKAGSESAAAKPKVKLASGMLTYDEGNVQTVVGDDGRVYKARSQKSLPSGVSMITEPIATTVNGQQALVGERGPEIVIGRKTTRAIQMNRPDLLRDLALIDRGITTRKVRTFDEGNIQDLASAFTPAPADGQTQKDSQQDGQLTSEDARALTAAIGVFAQTVAAMQKNGIPSYIKKYGTGGLIEEVQSGLKFVSKYK